MKEGLPVLLVHAYWLRPYNPQKPDVLKPDVATKATIRAAEFLYKDGKIGGVIFTAGNDKGKPPISPLMAKQTQIRNVIPQENVLVFYGNTTQGANDTFSEVELFKQAANHYGFNQLADVARESHRKSIQATYETIFGSERTNTVTTFDTEKVLLEYEPRYAGFIDRARKSPQEKAYKNQEAIKNMIYRLPFGIQIFHLVGKAPFKAAMQTYVLYRFGGKKK